MSADAEEVPGGGARRRIPFLDQARGAALLAMFWYHLSWDLTYFGLAGFALLEDPFWLAARAAILSAFLAISGVALALATRDRLAFGALLRRLGVVAAAALAVSVATRLAFPETWIFFGVLHCIAVSGLLALPLLRLPWPAVAALGLALLVLPVLPGVPRLEHDGLLWLGLVDAVPPSNDYVPVLPWSGVVLLGLAAGRALPWHRAPALPAAPGRLLARAGRHTLPLYLVHQPVFLALVWLWVQAVPPPDRAVAAFLAACAEVCEADAGRDCRRYCGCVVDALQAAGQWRQALAGPLPEPEAAAVRQACLPPVAGVPR